MDYLRSCYKSYMRPYRDRPDVLVYGSWHFCRPGALPIPFKHRFGSYRWDSAEVIDDPPLGEARHSFGWTAGTPLPHHQGVHFCGDADVWLNGLLYADRPGLEIDADGVPTCCRPHLTYFHDVAFELERFRPAPRPVLEWAWELETSYPVPVGQPEWAWELESRGGRTSWEWAWELESYQDAQVTDLEPAFELETDQPHAHSAQVHAVDFDVSFGGDSFVHVFTLDYDSDAFWDEDHPNGLKGTTIAPHTWRIRVQWHLDAPYTGWLRLRLTNAETDTEVLPDDDFFTDVTDVDRTSVFTTGNTVRRGVSVYMGNTGTGTATITFSVDGP